MPAMSWIDAVKRSKKLRVYAGELEGTWAKIASDSVRDFNALSELFSLGVKLVLISAKDHGAEPAQVLVTSGNGEVELVHDRTTYAGKFDGSRMHGLTLLAHRQQQIELAKIILPSQPLVNTPNGQRDVGLAVKKVILLHEFIHACGLTNSEHSTEGLFQANPSVDIGDTPSGDKVRRSARPGRVQYMPPFVVSEDTKGHVKRLWN